jgi:TPR repeat protein
MQIPAWSLVMLLMLTALEAQAELVRCTSKNGKSSVIRRDKCDSPDDIRTPVQAKQAIRQEPAPAAQPADDAMAAYKAGDFARARQLFEPRAEKGDALAQIMMGDMYRNGNGVAKDDRAAYTWIRKAADQGDARGQAALAAVMQAGRGTPRDEAGAVMWLQKSANQGFSVAQVALASAYLNGRGTPKDEAKGLFWLRKAADQGDSDAAYMLKQLGK